MSDHPVQFTPEALSTLQDMRQRINQVACVYGRRSDEYVEMLESFSEALVGIVRLGGRISADGDLSLLGVSIIVYGVVFFPRKHNGDRDPLLGSWSLHS